MSPRILVCQLAAKCIACLALLIVASCSHSRESRYEELDKAVAEREQYMKKKEANIANLQHQITPNISLEAKYHICNRIFEEYLAYKADSAQKYLSITADIARRIGNREYINDTEINQSALLRQSRSHPEEAGQAYVYQRQLQELLRKLPLAVHYMECVLARGGKPGRISRQGHRLQ